MKRIRIGKDISMRWEITTDGVAIPLEGRDLTIEIKSPAGIENNIPYRVEGNILIMTYYGYEQKRTGEYSITLWEKKGKPGQNVVDVIRAFELVRTSQEENDFVGGDLQIESVDLGTENFDILTEGGYRAINIDTLQAEALEDSVNINGKTYSNESFTITLPKANLDSAGVMSASDVRTLKEHADSIAQIKTSCEENAADIERVSNVVDTHESRLGGIDAEISSLNTEVSTLQSKVDENTTSIPQINNTIADHEESILQINTKLEEHTESINAKITTDRIEDGAVTSEKIATSAFDSTLSVSGKIAPADAVGEKLSDLKSEAIPIKLEINTISGGVDADNPARARTVGYIKGPCIIDVADGYVLIGAFPYTLNPDGTYTYVGDWEVYNVSSNNILLSNNYYYRLIFKRSDNANFSKTELADIILRITKQTDAPSAKDVFSSFNNWKKIDPSGWLNAYVNNYLQVVSSEQSLCSQPIELEKGDVLFVETKQIYRYPIVVVPTANAIAVGDTLTFVDGIFDSTNGHYAKQFIYKAKEKVFAIITINKAYNRIYVFRNTYNLVSNTVKDRINLLPGEAERKQNYYINVSNKWEVGGFSVCFEVFSGGKATIKSNSSYNAIYALLKKSYDVPSPGSAKPLFMDGETGRHTVPVGTSVDIAIPEDGYLYVYKETSGLVNYYPDLVNIFSPVGIHIRSLNHAIADGYLNKGISAKNVWRMQSVNLPAGCYFNVKAGDKVTIVANSASYAIIAFLRNTAGGQDEAANFANGTSERTTITAGTSQTFGIIEDCLLYVYIQADSTTVKYAPNSILLYETETKPELTITRQAVNLAKTINLFTGVDNSGKLIADMSHVAVSPVLINIGGDWYKKARYIHACCYANGAYAFNASKIVFLTDVKAVVSIITNVLAAVEIPANAYWAVVEFPSGSTMHFVGINNQSLLKTYCAYDERNLIADSLPIYEKIQNTDGAISHMIDVALDYMPFPYLGMGYGDIATAFDDVVEPVASELPDTSPQHYEGEKLQMNCSTFVMLCLLGVFYKNSRYNTPNGKNIGDGYQFDDQAEYNYFYTKAPYQYIYGADFGKMYANKLAKYAFDRGLLYLIKPDLSNIEPGDVLFDGQMYDGNFFMKIGHTMFVADVELKADGTKRVTIFETAAGSRVLVYDKEHWGARFPLPNRNIVFENIVLGFEPISESVTANANTNVELGAYNLTKNIQSKKHYTLEIVGNLPDTVNVGIKGGTKTIEINRRELYKRGDGVNTKHFWFLMNDSVGISQITLYINSSSALSMEEITIDSLRISEGRFTL